MNTYRDETLETAIDSTLGAVIREKYITPTNVTIEQVDGIDTKDYPDFVDAYVSAAFCKPLNRPLTDEELDYFNTEYGDAVHDAAYNQLF